MITTANPPPTMPNPKQDQGRSDEHDVSEAGTGPASYAYWTRTVTAHLSLTPEELTWIDNFLTALEAKGFFDEAKARDIRTILE